MITAALVRVLGVDLAERWFFILVWTVRLEIMNPLQRGPGATDFPDAHRPRTAARQSGGAN